MVKLREEAHSKFSIAMEDFSSWKSLWVKREAIGTQSFKELAHWPDWACLRSSVTGIPPAQTPHGESGTQVPEPIPQWAGVPRKPEQGQLPQRRPRQDSCLWKHAPSTSRRPWGEEAMTQTWCIFCGLVGWRGVGSVLHVNVSLKLKSWKTPQLFALCLWLTSSNVHSDEKSFIGGLERRVCFFK